MRCVTSRESRSYLLQHLYWYAELDHLQFVRQIRQIRRCWDCLVRLTFQKRGSGLNNGDAQRIHRPRTICYVALPPLLRAARVDGRYRNVIRVGTYTDDGSAYAYFRFAGNEITFIA